MIKSITFKKDFRTFKEGDEFTFKPGVNVLVGDQGSGKSTLIELLRSLIKRIPFNESDSSYRAESISKFDVKIEDLVTIDSDKKKIVAFDFERESARDMSALHYDMIGEQMAAMKSSHGQGNLISIDSLLKKVKADLENIGSILLDEPDAAMSPRSCYGLVGMFDGIANKWNKQLIVAAHNPIIIRGINPLIHKEPVWTEVLDLEMKQWMESQHYLITQMGPRELPEETTTRENQKRKSKKAT